MWQFAEAVRGLADGCQQLGTPVTGGNVSFYNQTGTTADPADAGHRRARRDRRRRAAASPSGFSARRRADLPARRDPRRVRRLGVGRTSCTASSAGCRRRVDLAREQLPGRRARRRRARRNCSTPRTTCPTAAWRRRWSSRACAAAPACTIDLPEDLDPFVALFSESARPRDGLRPARARRPRSPTLCDEHGLPYSHASAWSTSSRPTLDVRGQFRISLRELRAAWSATLPRALRVMPRRRRAELDAYAAQARAAGRLARAAACRIARRRDRAARLDAAHARRPPGRAARTEWAHHLGTSARRPGDAARAVRPCLRARRGRHHRRHARPQATCRRTRLLASLRAPVVAAGPRRQRGDRRPARADHRARLRPHPHRRPVVHCDDLSRSFPDREPVPLLRPALATAVRTLAEILAAQAPGRSVEVRVAAVHRRPGRRRSAPHPRHAAQRRRDRPVTWLRLATGRETFAAAAARRRNPSQRQPQPTSPTTCPSSPSSLPRECESGWAASAHSRGKAEMDVPLCPANACWDGPGRLRTK